MPTEDTRELEEIERETREQEAKNKAVVLEMIGDLPEADAKPPPNMLFICKLNQVTTEEVVLLRILRGLILDCLSCLLDQCGGHNLSMWHPRRYQAACSKHGI